MKYSKRVKKIAKAAMELVDKEFDREWLISVIVGFSFSERISYGIDPTPTIDEAKKAIECLEKSGRLIENVIGIHIGENNGFLYSTDFYPHTTKRIRDYKKSRPYRLWLGLKKYGSDGWSSWHVVSMPPECAQVVDEEFWDLL
jgi:hypothetical protein